jgi:DNA replication protein DnaC
MNTNENHHHPEYALSPMTDRTTNPEEVTWECVICGVQEPRSYTWKNVTYYSYRKCACQRAEEARLEKEKQHLERLESHANDTYGWLGTRWNELPLRKKTFENFRSERQLNAYNAAQSFAVEPSGTLILHGTYGTGKTHLLAAICNEALQRYGMRSLFTTSTKLFAAIQQKISNHEDHYSLVERAVKTPLLALDDVDKAKWSEFREEIYFAIIDERVKRELPIALSTNRLEELDSFVGGAVYSRLKVGQIAIAMGGKDYREEI